MKTLNTYKLSKLNILFFLLLFFFSIKTNAQRINKSSKTILKENVIIKWNKKENTFEIKTTNKIKLKLLKNNKLLNTKMIKGTVIVSIPYRTFNYKINEIINKNKPIIEIHIYTEKYLNKLKHNEIILENLNSVDLNYYQDFDFYNQDDKDYNNQEDRDNEIQRN